MNQWYPILPPTLHRISQGTICTTHRMGISINQNRPCDLDMESGFINPHHKELVYLPKIGPVTLNLGGSTS